MEVDELLGVLENGLFGFVVANSILYCTMWEFKRSWMFVIVEEVMDSFNKLSSC